jgi:hypothetical protein
MKKNILIVTILSVILYSCKKDDLVVTDVAGPGICNLSGEVFANYNTCNDTIMPQFGDAVNDVNVTFVLNSRDLDRTPVDNFEYEDISYTTQIVNGQYSIELPAISTPYNVQVYFDSYNHNQTSCTFTNEWVDTAWVTSINYSNYTQNFSLSPINISGVIEGGSIVQNFNYNN